MGRRRVGGPGAAVRAAGMPRPAGSRLARRGPRVDRVEPRDRAPERGVSDPVRRLRRDRGPRSRALDQPAVRDRARHAQGRRRAPTIREPGHLAPLHRRADLRQPGPPHHLPDLSASFVPDLRTAIRDALVGMPESDGFDVKVTGFPALDHDVRTISAEDTERSEQRALPLTLAVLIVAFGALVAATLPVIVGVLAITIALGLVTIAAHYLPMSVFVLNITTMVGLGVGIDYSLLIVTRFREELNRGLAPADAALRTVETAGSAVVTSGLTVVVGFAALVTTPLSDTRSVGVGGLLVVSVAVLLATTFLPAVLAILGRNIDRPKWLARPLARFHAPTGWERWARWLGHRPWRAVAVGGAAIALLTFPLSQIRLGLPATNWFPPESESGQGLQALREMGASGVIQPVRVVVQLPEGESALSGRRLPGLKALTDSIRKDPRVREVRGIASIKPNMSTHLAHPRVLAD